jgi:hypothetical protein
MKKWIVWLIVLAVLTVGCIYLFIPANIDISSISSAKATLSAEFRYISREESWEKWWRNADGQPHIKGQAFEYNGTIFRLTGQNHNIVYIEVENGGLKLQTILTVISFSKDSTGNVWHAALKAGNNPLNRIRTRRTAVRIKKDLSEVLRNLTSFVSETKNVYGLSIQRTSIRDTTMLTASFVSGKYPSLAEIYSFFDTVENSIRRQKGLSSGSPIMNIRALDGGGYETQVAIPTNRLLENDGKVHYRRMVPGNFMATEIQGGPVTIEQAMKEMEQYVSDYGKIVMAKPFQMLVTNRLTETDTAKWITKIYFPVVE